MWHITQDTTRALNCKRFVRSTWSQRIVGRQLLPALTPINVPTTLLKFVHQLNVFKLIHEFIYYSEFLICNHSTIYVFIYEIGQIKYFNNLRIYLNVFILTQVAYRYRIKAHA